MFILWCEAQRKMRQALREDTREDDDEGLRAKRRPKAKAKGKGKSKGTAKTNQTGADEFDGNVTLADLEVEDQEIRNEIDLPDEVVPVRGRGRGRGCGRGPRKRATPAQPTDEDSHLNFCWMNTIHMYDVCYGN